MIVTAPKEFTNLRSVSVFLAGTIDNGESQDWQLRYAQALNNLYGDKVTIYNPRRNDWNAEASDTDILQQIAWEQKYIRSCDIVLFNFLAGSRSPITLLELGQCLGYSKDIVVVCPKEFWRYLNVRHTVLLHDRLVYGNMVIGMSKLVDKIDSRLK